MQPKIVPDLCQQQSGRQQENRLAPVFWSTIESDIRRCSCPYKPTLRNSLLCECPNGEQILQSVGFKDREKSVEQEVATSTTNTQQGQSISSKVAAVDATTISTSTE